MKRLIQQHLSRFVSNQKQETAYIRSEIEVPERSEFSISCEYKGFELIDFTNRWIVVYQPYSYTSAK